MDYNKASEQIHLITNTSLAQLQKCKNFNKNAKLNTVKQGTEFGKLVIYTEK